MKELRLNIAGEPPINLLEFGGFNEMLDFTNQRTLTRTDNINKMDLFNIEPDRSRLRFLGAPDNITTKEQLNSYNSFQNFELLDSFKDRVQYRLDEILRKDQRFQAKKKKLLFTERDFGIFNFDKASQGLFKIKVDNVEKVVTSEKKIYTIFENKNSDKKSISIYCYAGANKNITASEMLYTGISATLLTEKLLQLGYNVEFKTIIASTYNDTVYGSIVTIKEFENEFDRNTCILSTSDPSFFRWNGFKNLIAVSDYYKSNIPYSYGAMWKGNFKRVMDEVDKKNNVKKTNIVLGKSYSEDEAIRSITEIINNL